MSADGHRKSSRTKNSKHCWMTYDITGDEKWINYVKPTSRKLCVTPGEPSRSTVKPSSERRPCDWPNEEMKKLKQAIREKRPQWTERHETLILQQKMSKHSYFQVQVVVQNIKTFEEVPEGRSKRIENYRKYFKSDVICHSSAIHF